MINAAVHLLTVGFNHKKTPLSLREKFAFDRAQSINLSKSLTSQEVIEECLVLSTCNRTEVYATGPCLDGVKETIYQTLAEMIGCDTPEFTPLSYCLTEAEALKHLFRVASSLDAMVVGEAQVLGQIKAAYQTASEYNTVGPFLHKAFHAAFRAAKKVRTETDIAQLPVSVGTLAVELAENCVGDLTKKNVLVIGAGEMSSLVALHLKERGAAHIWIANRSQPAAQSLAQQVGGVIVPFSSWNVHMQTADIVISSIGGGPLIRKAHVEKAMSNRPEGPLVIIDLALPRNADEIIAKIPEVSLYNIDDLQGLADRNLSARKEAADRAEKIVETEARLSFAELGHIKLAPMLSRLQKKCTLIVKNELEKLYAVHPQFTDEERKSVNLCAESIVKKILHDPIRLSKEELARPGSNGIEVTTALCKIFHIGDQ